MLRRAAVDKLAVGPLRVRRIKQNDVLIACNLCNFSGHCVRSARFSFFWPFATRPTVSSIGGKQAGIKRGPLLSGRFIKEHL